MVTLDDFYILIASNDFLYSCVQLLSYFLDFYLTCIELRFCISWFLNINPYFEPFNTLWEWTDPFFNFGRGMFPRIFMMDFSSVISYQILASIREACDRIFYMHKIYVGEPLSAEIQRFLETYHQSQ
jgi:YggT family protein